MQVFEDQDNRSLASNSLKDCPHFLQQLEAGLFGAKGKRGFVIGDDVLIAQLKQDLGPGPVSRRSASLPGKAPIGVYSCLSRLVAGNLCQRALADARFASNQQYAAPASLQRLERGCNDFRFT